MSRIELSPELSILVRASLGPVAGLGDSANVTVNWKRLLALSHWHQVRPLAYEHLQDQPAVPTKALETLKTFTLGQAVTNMAFLGIGVDLFIQLRARSIDAFPMKGALWAWMLYEKPGLREFGDIDFFIKRESVQKSLAVLLQNNFAPDAYRDYLLHQHSLSRAYLDTDYQLPLTPTTDHALQSLEIQWNCSYPRYRYNFSWEELMQNPQVVTLMGTQVEVPRMENQLIMLIIHHAGVEQWDKLKYMADFVRLLRKSGAGMDWDYINEVTLKKGFNKLLIESLGVVSLLTGEDFNQYSGTAKQYPSETFLSEILKHWESSRPSLKTKTWRILLYNIKYRDKWSDRLAVVAAHLSYFMHWKLLWHKMTWYRGKKSNKAYRDLAVDAVSGR